MTVEEIFKTIITHMQEGITYHDEMSKAYKFLGLYGYSKFQEYQYCEEICSYKQLFQYYITHYFKLLKTEDTIKEKIIPEIWYKYTTQAVDVNTKQKSIKELMTFWIQWEITTKKLYQEMRQELTSINELDAALTIDKYIIDVSKELSKAEKQLINLEAINYSMEIIIPEQDKLFHKYKKKLGW